MIYIDRDGRYDKATRVAPRVRSELLRSHERHGSRLESCLGGCRTGRVWECRIRDQCQTLEVGATSSACEDESANWRLIYRVDADAIVLLEVFAKKTGKTPVAVIRACKSRLKRYDELA